MNTCTCNTRLLRNHGHDRDACQRPAEAKCEFCDQELCWKCADYHSHSSFRQLEKKDRVSRKATEKGE